MVAAVVSDISRLLRARDLASIASNRGLRSTQPPDEDGPPRDPPHRGGRTSFEMRDHAFWTVRIDFKFTAIAARRG